METKNELGYDEVVDTLADLLDVVDIVKLQLKDGFQFTDAFSVMQIYPKLKEVFDDRKVFVSQFLDMTPGESDQAVLELSERIGAEVDVLKGKIVQVLILTSSTYTYLDMVINGGRNLASSWQGVFVNNTGK
jgi:hypothetical protein